MNLTHKLLGIQDGIQRLSLQKVLAIHFLQKNNTKNPLTKKKQRVFAVRRHNESLCGQEQPRIDQALCALCC